MSDIKRTLLRISLFAVFGLFIGLIIRFLSNPSCLNNTSQLIRQMILVSLFLFLVSWFLYRGGEAVVQRKFTFIPIGDMGFVRRAYHALFGRNYPVIHGVSAVIVGLIFFLLGIATLYVFFVINKEGIVFFSNPCFDY